jgi:hypothetical protein
LLSVPSLSTPELDAGPVPTTDARTTLPTH